MQGADAFTALLSAPVGEAATAAQCAGLAWLLWMGGRAKVDAQADGWRVTLADAPAMPADWLADAMERLGGPSPG
ncbi:hypothetical protein D9M68_993330 [compost metagenome]